MTQAQLLKALSALLTADQPKSRKASAKTAPKAKMTKEEFEVALVEACKKAGYASPEPRFNILTYDRWVEKGRRVRAGEKGIKVAGRKTRLFHEAQTDVIPVVQPQVSA